MSQDRLVVPTCEISMDPETAIELGSQWGIRHYELKTVWEDRRVPFITDKQKENLKQALDYYNADIVALSPGLFISAEARDEAAEQELRVKLPMTIALADELDAKIIVVFTFRRTAGVEESWVVEQLKQAAAQVEGSDLTLVIEPLESNYGNSGQSISRIVRAVNSPHLRVNCDTANIARAGYKAFPDEYEHIKDLISYVHLKNHLAADTQWVLLDHSGADVDMKAQLRALLENGYDGYLSVETHTRYNRGQYPPIVAHTRHNVEVMHRWLNELEHE